MNKALSSFGQKILAFSEKDNLLNCSDIVVGLSGGPDSVALICVLKEIFDFFDNENRSHPVLHVVHVNHGIRGEEADADEAFSKDLAESLDVDFVSYSFDIPELAQKEGRTLEEMGRIKRYEVLNLEADKYKDSRIAVAHHFGDVGETMLMNLFRGSGLDGLVPMDSVSGRIIRPLIMSDKAEILSYLNENNISYRIDSTNKENDATRNYWRNVIIPEISSVSNKKPNDALKDAYSLLSDDLEFINQMVDDMYEDSIRVINNHPYLSCSSVCDSRPSVAGRLVRKLWKDIFGNLTDFSKVHVDAVLDFIMPNGKGTGTLDMPFERLLIKNNGEITFADSDKKASVDKDYAFDMGFFVGVENTNTDIVPGKTTKIPNTTINIETQIVENIGDLEYNISSLYLPVKKEESNIKLRVISNISEHSFRNAGSVSTKKLGKVFIDRHVPKSVRDSILAIAADNEILWVPGVGHSQGFTGERSFEAWSRNNDEINEVKFIRISFLNLGGA